MPDIEKPTVGVVDDADANIKDTKMMGATEEANAVGYREYLEALDLEISDKEVSPSPRSRRLRYTCLANVITCYRGHVR